MSKTPLTRPIYIRAPREMRIDEGIVMKVIKPFYGKPESPVHWFKTCTDYHSKQLGMKQSKLDPSMVFPDSKGILEGAIWIQVDDAILTGTPECLKWRKSHQKSLRVKKRKLSAPQKLNSVACR